MKRKIIPVGFYVGECNTTGCGTAYFLLSLDHYTEKFRKLVLLNALVPPRNEGVLAVSPPLTIDEVKEIVAKAEAIESYIGHQSTAELLTKLLGVKVECNRAMYNPQPDDYALIVRLKKRLSKPEDIKNVTEDDLEFRLVLYSEFEP